MITRIQRLNYKCKICKKRADFEIIKTNDDLPDGYYKGGERSLHFCIKHLPKDCKKFWNSEVLFYNCAGEIK